MSRFFVDISGIDDDRLGFLGYTKIAEDSNFKIYRHYGGDIHIVDKLRPKLFVDDLNDAAYINAGSVIVIPGD